jgi:hypothetical protein
VAQHRPTSGEATSTLARADPTIIGIRELVDNHRVVPWSALFLAHAGLLGGCADVDGRDHDFPLSTSSTMATTNAVIPRSSRGTSMRSISQPSFTFNAASCRSMSARLAWTSFSTLVDSLVFRA